MRYEPHATSPNILGGYSGNARTAGVYGATISGGGTSGSVNTVTDIYGTVGGGVGNTAGDNAGTVDDTYYCTVGGGYYNTASGHYAAVGGGNQNTASGGYGSAITGGYRNTASGSIGATVCGGYDNVASGTSGATVVGGRYNTASGQSSTVCGGWDSTASGKFSTVAGGYENATPAGNATVSGGSNNTASGWCSGVGSGDANAASGHYSAVPGGQSNAAAGQYTLAAGRRAKANHDGAFVWADSTDADFGSTAANQFLIRAAGGVGIGLTNPSEALDVSGNIEATGTLKSGSSITIDGDNHQITSDGDLDVHVSDGRALQIETHATSPNLIGGYSGNAVTAGAYGCVVAGGGADTELNRATDPFCTVGGGVGNVAGDDDGDFSLDDADAATVGGGFGNTASNLVATVSGGEENTASGDGSTVGGGLGNTASGDSSTVPGGEDNTAAGQSSFAAGYRAKANHGNTFVWADGTEADFVSTGASQYLIRAAGGVGIGLDNPSEALDVSGNIEATGTLKSGSSITIDGDNHQFTSDGDLELHVSDGRALRIESDTTSPNLLGGYSGNQATAGTVGGTIGGGGMSSGLNYVTDHYGTVGGGAGNRAGNSGGGVDDKPYATVAGGQSNAANGGYAAIGGGSGNAAGGEYSAVPGGRSNETAGDYALAAGRRAKANHDGAFVWADSTDADFASTATNQFLVRAVGGVGIGTTSPGSALDVNGTVTCTGFAMATGASGGYVLTSDASGNGTWQALGGGSNWLLTGNAGTTAGTNFLGTTDNQALEVKANSARVMRYEPSATSPNLLGGYHGNTISAQVVGGTIGGGGYEANVNSVTDHYGTVGGGAKNRAGDGVGEVSDAEYATVGGGEGNLATDDHATVAGGKTNTASSTHTTVGGGILNQATADSATVAGGCGNTATDSGAFVGGGFYNDATNCYTVVAGGQSNTASQCRAAVGGGENNTASGQKSTVPGGKDNLAAGDYSFAAGYKAKADHRGAFVWSDSTGTDYHSSGTNQFDVRASGGVYLHTNGTATSGVYLSAGGSAWNTVSDRAKKRDFAAVDGRAVLEKVVALPLSTWTYKAQDGVRHMGPMAQDLYAAFGLGVSDKSICTIDADGVNMAAIQGLYGVVQEKDAKLAKQAERIRALEERLDRMEAVLKTLAGPAEETDGAPPSGF
jgi:hypothetical protein